MLNLLDIEFAETNAPSGVVTINFSGGAALRLEVECLEAELADLGPSWRTAACPVHALRRGRPAGQSQSQARLGRNAAINFGSELRARRPAKPRFA